MKKVIVNILAWIAFPILVFVVMHTPPIPAVSTPPAVEQAQK
jgi:hypothetical protein